MHAADDDALLGAMAAGDQDAAARFVRRHQRQVYGLAFSITGDGSTAEDVAQEAFTRAWRHAQSFDARRASATTWLLTITRNLAIDTVRVRRSDPADPASMAALLGAANAPGPAELAEAGTDRRALVEALGRLPVEQRRALVLATIGGRTSEEVSAAEGIPLGTAKTRIRAALHRLRVDLAQPSMLEADGSAPGTEERER
jgi:RNA polymerase sigma-70 factor (ECF subfamily)